MKRINPILTPQILNLISEIDEFKGRWTATQVLEPERLASLRHVATIESIGSSTRIEGGKLSNSEIETLLRGLKVYSFRSRDEQEVAGYAEAMDMIFHQYREIPLTENHLKQLHGVLLKYSVKDERHRGEYKKFPNHVEAFDPKGKSLGIIFKTTSPFDTPAQMKNLVAWITDELDKKEYHPLLIVAIFVVTFLKIHPFQDGNGRLSRTLTTLLLLRLGYAYVPYSSMERIIEENKDRYYLTLRQAQTEQDGNKSSAKGITQWITFFLQCMKTQKDVLAKKLADELAATQIPKLSLQIIELIKGRGPTSVAEVVAVTGANRNTVKAHFKKLTAKGVLTAQGSGRSVKYHLSSSRFMQKERRK